MVELEIAPKRPADKYDKEIQCDIPDPRAQRLGRITEDEEYDNWQSDFDQRFEGVQRV